MDEKMIIRLFPEIEDITDKILRQGVVSAWVLAVKKGQWDTIDDIPFTLLVDTKKTLIEHTRTVTRMAQAIASKRSDISKDIVIAGALVHDIGKLLEYKRQKGRFTKSDYGKRIRHPVSGYALAIEAGLPIEVAHIIATHSVEGEKVQRTKEAIVINHCDFIDFDIERSE